MGRRRSRAHPVTSWAGKAQCPQVRKGITPELREVLTDGSAWPARELLLRGADRSAELRDWGERVGSLARDALHVATRLAEYVPPSSGSKSPVLGYFGASRASHAFRSEPLAWLRMTEVQSTKGLAAFLDDGGSARVLAFLRALAPHVEWPTSFDQGWADAEVPAGRGRIDLLVRARAGSRIWGAVVEAKFGHHARSNPLADYRRTALRLGLRPWTPGSTEGSAAYLILGEAKCAATRRRLDRNKDWTFTAWRQVLRRFERELDGLADDEEFRRFRRTLWERSG